MHSFRNVRNIIEATEKFSWGRVGPGGGGIWTAFRPSEGGIWTEIFQKFKCPGGCWSFDLTGTLIWIFLKITNNRTSPKVFAVKSEEESHATQNYKQAYNIPPVKLKSKWTFAVVC